MTTKELEQEKKSHYYRDTLKGNENVEHERKWLSIFTIDGLSVQRKSEKAFTNLTSTTSMSGHQTTSNSALGGPV